MKINNQNLIKQLHLKNEEALAYVIDEYDDQKLSEFERKKQRNEF